MSPFILSLPYFRLGNGMMRALIYLGEEELRGGLVVAQFYKI